MTESSNISLFGEKDGSCKMDNKEDEKQFKVLDDYEGYIFTRREIVALGVVELEAFNRALRRKRIKFIAGTSISVTKGRRVERIVNKKRLLALGLDVKEQYFQFVKGWKDPSIVNLEQVLKEKKDERYWDIKVYADTIDRRVEEAERLKERKRIKKIDYELDDTRGWTKVTEDEHRRVRKKAQKPSKIDEEEWKRE